MLYRLPQRGCFHEPDSPGQRELRNNLLHNSKAFQSVEGSLEDIRLFHTDRGNEFKNQTIEELLETFHIERSLIHKGCPYDNAVADATFKIIKTEFVWNETFADLSELKLKLWDYVHWYNHHGIHSALGYETPVQYRENNLKKVV